MNKILLITLVVLTLLTPNLVGAQTFGGGSLNLSLTPTFPGPNQTVTVSVRSYSANIDTATVSWFLDGSLLERGRGLKSYSFKTGDVGEKNTIKAVVSDGPVTLEAEKTLFISDVDIVWESKTYKPAWYKGKSLYTPGAPLKVVAIPHTSLGGNNPPSLIYTWGKNGRVLGSLSGRGKDTLSVETGPLDETLEISVTIQDGGGNLLTKKRKTITRTNPVLSVYVESPLLGTITNRSVEESFNMEESEVTFKPIPFFFSIPSPLVPSMNYSWTLNGSGVETLDDSVTFKQTGEGGVGSVRIRVEQDENILNSTSKSFDIIFGQ